MAALPKPDLPDTIRIDRGGASLFVNDPLKDATSPDLIVNGCFIFLISLSEINLLS
jgi:hypothetical protein